MKTRTARIQALRTRALQPRAKAATACTSKRLLRNNLLGAALVASVLLATAILLTPAPAAARMTIAVRVGDAAVRFSDAAERPLPLVAKYPLTLKSVAPRVLVASPASPRCGARIARLDRRQGEPGPIWVPGHYEKKSRRSGHGRQVWIPGHWRRI